jgi:uncharacterized protein YbbK (DUF523 family)
VRARPRVGISRCLLGDRVRYDGGHKREPSLIEAAEARVEWVPVCPELEAGMGVPREPIHLVARHGASDDQVRAVEGRTGRDWTDRLAVWTRQRLGELEAMRLSGFVLKARSPSCGPRGVPILTGDERRTMGSGLFAAALMAAFPGLPVEDEERLRDPVALGTFLDRVAAYRAAEVTSTPDS